MLDKWSYLFNKLYDHYANQCADEFISEEEMERHIDEIEQEDLPDLWNRCQELEIPVSRGAEP